METRYERASLPMQETGNQLDAQILSERIGMDAALG
jgi:hypothetical protein